MSIKDNLSHLPDDDAVNKAIAYRNRRTDVVSLIHNREWKLVLLNIVVSIQVYFAVSIMTRDLEALVVPILEGPGFPVSYAGIIAVVLVNLWLFFYVRDNQ
jgi:hypothetical protein